MLGRKVSHVLRLASQTGVSKVNHELRLAGQTGISKFMASLSVGVPEGILKPLQISEKTLLGPGPSNVPDEVKRALQLPMLGYLHPDFLNIMTDTKQGIKYLFQTTNPITLAVSGTGHAGMEASLMNLLEPGDPVLILENGIWGGRAADMADRQGALLHKLVRPPGEAFTFQEIKQAVETHKPRVLFVCHGESSTGVLHSLEGLGDLCHSNDCLLLVDTVASLGATPFLADDWGVDCVYSATQKTLSVPPGLAPISFSQRAWEKVLNRKTKPYSFYLDMKLVANYWGCDGEPPRYHHTGPISLVYALREGVARVANEGLENAIKRHQDNALWLHAGLEAMGLQLFVKNPKERLPSLTTVCVPEGVDWKGVIDHLNMKHKIEIAGGLGPTVGKIWRIGLMGLNSAKINVNRVLMGIKEALDQQSFIPPTN